MSQVPPPPPGPPPPPPPVPMPGGPPLPGQMMPGQMPGQMMPGQMMPGQNMPGQNMNNMNNMNMQLQPMPNNQLTRAPQGQGQRSMVPYTMPTVMDLRDDVSFPDMAINYYEAWSLRRATADPGHGVSWAKVTINKMPIASEEIVATYNKHIKQQSGQVTKIYNGLKSDKMRMAIDKAVTHRNNSESDNKVEWVLVHLDVTRKPLKGTIGNSAIETTQIAVVLKKSHKPEVLAAMRAAAIQRLNQPNMQFLPGQQGNPQFMGGIGNGGQQGNPHGNQHGGQGGGGGGGGGGRAQGNQGHPPMPQIQPQPTIVQHFSGGVQPVTGKNNKDKRSGSRSRQRSVSPDPFERIDRFLNRLEDAHHSRSHSDDSDTESMEIRDFKRRISKDHGKDSPEYRRLIRGLDERERRAERREERRGDRRDPDRRQRSKTRKGEGSRRRKSTPGPGRARTHSGTRRTKHHHRDGSESEESYEFINYSSSDSVRSSDLDTSSRDGDWRGGRRRRRGEGRRRSDFALERPPSIGGRRRSRTPSGDMFKQWAEMRRFEEDYSMPQRQLPYRTLSYPYSARDVPPSVPLMADMARKMSRQEEEAMRIQEERRAYRRGRMDAEREQNILDSESTSDYERRLEREIQATRGRLGRTLSSNADGWPGYRRNDWP